MDKKTNNNQNLPSGWRKMKLGEVGYIITGKTPPTRVKKYFGEKYPFITPSDINSFDVRYNYKTERFLSPDWYNKSKYLIIPKDSICFVCIGSTIGKMCLTREESFTNQQINTVIAKKEKADPFFLFYLLKNNQNNIVKEYGGGGAAKPIINKSTFENIELFIPEDINEQKRIASILSAFDDKIEVNNKIIKTLEEMAQEIFKEWFLRFRFPGWQKVKFVNSELGKIPEGWEVKFLSEFFDFLEGPGIRNWQYTTSGCRFINIRLIQNNDIDIKSANFISTEEANGKYKHFQLQERDMIVSTSGTLGRSAIVRKEHLPLLLNTSVIRFRPKDKKNYGFMYQFLNSIYFQNKILSMASGSAQPNFGPVHLKQIKLVVPNKDILNLFSTLIDPVYEKIIILKSENQKLATMRDLLLPKLMRGEIRV
jgi:type I restriction enzyme S subunit